MTVSDENNAHDLELTDALEVFRARCRIDQAVAELASSPLAVPAADRMRETLDDPALSAARAALSRLPQRPKLRVVHVDEVTP